ncbi:transporter [Methanoculleus taiwanensis]|uniref:Transporter n=1 Tax=Methanoculleus taiwanensis TaxID=1550565 RepID=A0A498H3Q1_9EURY|nr:AI-2E family transporter [Methanoculleus taiwanensis]RXE56748.1 transporter [Methanoculleus taiwanensis]
MTPPTISPPVRLLAIGAGIVILFGGMRAASSILGPLLLAVFLAMVTVPLLRWLERRGLPTAAASGVLIAGLIAASVALAAFVGVAFNQLVEALPAYQEQVQVRLSDLQSMLAASGVDTASLQLFDLLDRGMIIGQLAAFFRSLSTAVFDLVLILIGTGFLLLEASRLSTGIEQRLGPKSPLVGRFRQSSRILIDYVVVRTKVNLITGIGVGALLYALGVDFALLWGLLTFVLSYIPYIGLALAALPAAILAWLELGPLAVVIILVGVTIVNFIAESILFPQMAGEGLDLSPFVVLASVIFWGFILGAAGVFLAVPLTLAVKMLLENWHETRWLATLMSGGDRQEELT